MIYNYDLFAVPRGRKDNIMTMPPPGKAEELTLFNKQEGVYHVEHPTISGMVPGTDYYLTGIRVWRVCATT
jgi:hypothetical protein